jgi:hypothetical protein
MERLNHLISATQFTLIAAVIDKRALASQYNRPDNPYDIALCFCMERLHMFLAGVGQSGRRTSLIVESRGRVEDESLELAFRRICDGANRCGPMPEFDIVFADKRSNTTGLHIADLVVRPIGRKILKPEQSNRAFDLIEPKFRRNQAGVVDGFGLKFFPK